MKITDMVGITVGAVLGGEAMKQVGNIGGLSHGIKNITQTGIGLGVAGMAMKPLKGFFK